MSYKSSSLGSEVNFDVVTELTFEGNTDYDPMTKALTDPAVYDQIVKDKEQFMDRSPGGRLIFLVDEETTLESIPSAAATRPARDFGYATPGAAK